jgi:hypothetical protein
VTSNFQLRHLQTSPREIEEGAVLAYTHIAEMFNRSDAEEFSNSLAIMDKHLAEKFARYSFPVMPTPLYLPYFYGLFRRLFALLLFAWLI